MEGEKINGGDSFRDASFSYLRSDHHQQQRNSTTNRTSFGLERPKKSSDHEAEISVFGAERYFNTPISDNDANARLNLHRRSADDLHHDHHAASMRPGTPCSEGSWTSRSTALLLKSCSANYNNKNNNATSASRRSSAKRKLINGSRSFFATLGCTGKCSEDKSVSVANRRHQQKAVVDNNNNNNNNNNNLVSQETNDRLRYEARSTKRPEEHFAFPILNAATTITGCCTDDDNDKNNKSSTVVVEEAVEPPRMSLEVFGSKTTSKIGNDVIDEVAMNLERKLSVLTWDAIPSAKAYKTLSPKSANSVGNDLDSDASSDLFEIENMVVMSATATATARLDPPEEVDCTASPPCGYNYEPSEASIEWSVVTASACAAGDPGSDFDEKKLSANRKPPTQHKVRRSAGGGGILGCKSQKSVRVAENAHTTTT